MAKTPEFDLREDYGRNYIINGSLDFWQRGTSVLLNTQIFYLADRFFGSDNTSGSFTISQSTDVPNGDSKYSLQAQVTSTATPLITTQSAILGHRLEGYDLQKLKDKTFTLSFYVKSSIPGTYSFAVRNDASDKSYVAEYTINAANTWEKKSITITHDSSGLWNYENGVGLRLSWVLDAGPDFKTSTLAQWQNVLRIASSNQTSFMTNASATFKVAQIQLVEGSEDIPFRRAGGTFADELILCQRYFEKSYNLDINPGTPGDVNGAMQVNGISTPAFRFPTVFKVRKRALPTFNTFSTTTGAGNAIRDFDGGADRAQIIDIVGQTMARTACTTLANNEHRWHWTAEAEL